MGHLLRCCRSKWKAGQSEGEGTEVKREVTEDLFCHKDTARTEFRNSEKFQNPELRARCVFVVKQDPRRSLPQGELGVSSDYWSGIGIWTAK